MLTMRKKEEGFTLVELLVVIIIIGILAAIAIPVFLNQRQRANDAAVESAVKSYVTAAESFLVQNPNVGEQFGASGATITERSGAAKVLLRAEGARMTPGMNILVYGNPNSDTGYQICGWHPNGKDYKGNTISVVGHGSDKGMFKYDSATGQFTNPRGTDSPLTGPSC